MQCSGVLHTIVTSEKEPRAILCDEGLRATWAGGAAL